MENVGSSREALAEAAKQFKTSWVQFGEWLTNVATEKLYEEWGFKKFEDYCKSELGIRRSTAMKLTNAYFFLENQALDLKEKGLDLEVVSTLQQLKADENCPNDTYEELIDLAVNKGRTGETIKKAFKKATQGSDEDQTKEFYRKTQSMTKQLSGRIKPIDEVPEKFKSNLDEMFDFLEEHVKYSDV